MIIIALTLYKVIISFDNFNINLSTKHYKQRNETNFILFNTNIYLIIINNIFKKHINFVCTSTDFFTHTFHNSVTYLH